MQNEGMGIAIGNIFGDMMPKKTKHKKLPVKEARKILREQEAQSMLDMDQVVDEALMNAEQNGIVFIDEIDKIASGSSVTASGEVSREGVQRDILPIVEAAWSIRSTARLRRTICCSSVRVRSTYPSRRI